MTSKRPAMYQNDQPTWEGIAKTKPSVAKLPPHIASIRLPNGRALGELKSAEIARLCAIAGVPGAHEAGREENATRLVAILDAVGKQAAETAIKSWLAQTFGDAA